MDSTGTNMCKAVEIEGVAVKATFESRVCVGGNLINVIQKESISINLCLVNRNNTQIMFCFEIYNVQNMKTEIPYII